MMNFMILAAVLYTCSCISSSQVAGAPFNNELIPRQDHTSMSIPKWKEILKESLDNVVVRKHRIMMLLRLLCDVSNVKKGERDPIEDDLCTNYNSVVKVAGKTAESGKSNRNGDQVVDHFNKEIRRHFALVDKNQ